MLGKVIDYKLSKKFGFIKGEDSKRYFFHTDDWFALEDPKSGILVEFKIKNEKKGLKAIGIKEVPMSKGREFEKDNLIKTYKTYFTPSDFLYIKGEGAKVWRFNAFI